MKCRTNDVELRLSLSGIFFVLMHGNRLFLINATLRIACSISVPGWAYGQNDDF